MGEHCHPLSVNPAVQVPDLWALTRQKEQSCGKFCSNAVLIPKRLAPSPSKFRAFLVCLRLEWKKPHTWNTGTKEWVPFKLLCHHLEFYVHSWLMRQPSFMSHRPGGSEQIIHFGESRRDGQGMSMARLGGKHPQLGELDQAVLYQCLHCPLRWLKVRFTLINPNKGEGRICNYR